MTPAPGIAAHAEAERALLACVLAAPKTLADVANMVEPGDFGDARAGALWATALDALRRGAPISAATLTAAAPELGELVEAAFAGWVGSGVEHARHFAGLIRTRAQRRRLLLALESAARAVIEGGDGDAAELTDRALESILAATAGRETVESATARELCEGAFRAATDRTPLDVVATGFLDVDHHLAGGLQRGNVLTIGARTSVGKTAVGVALARNAAEAGHRALIVSLEMSRAELGDRVLSQVTGVGLRELRSRRLAADELRRLADAQNTVRAWGDRLEVIDRGVRSVGALASALRRRAARGQAVRLVVLDYAQLLTLPHGASLREGLSIVSHELKALAADAGVSLVLLAQLRREAEGRPGDGGRVLLRPSLADLKETGAFEEDSDVVLLLWRDGAEDLLRVDIGKNRHGAAGVTATLGWHGPTATPRNLALHESAGAARGRR